MAKDIVKEMVAATKLKPRGKGEDLQAFLDRLHKAINKLEEADWELLSDPVQKWFNAGSTASDEKKDLPVPAGMTAEKEEAEEEAEEVEAGAEEEAPKKKKKAKATKAKEAKPAKAEKKAKGKKAKKEGTTGRPRFDDDAVLVRKVKTLPEGNRNDHWDKIPAGTKFGKIRKNKTLLRVTRYWRRKGFVELRAA